MRKKVLVIGHHLVVLNYQELIDQIAINLNSQDIDVFLITPDVYKEKIITNAQDYPNKKFNHIKLKTVFGKSGRQHAYFYFGLKSVIKNIRPNVIFCMEEPNSIVSVQINHIAKKYSVRVILWSALNQYRDYSKYPLYDIRRYLYPLCLKYNFDKSFAINALDESVKNVLLKKNYQKEIYVNNTFGVNHFFFKKPTLNLGDKLRVIFVGVLEKYKGVNFLISAVKNCNVELNIIGDGSERDTLQEMSKEGNISFHGFKDQYDVKELISYSDILVLPSVPIDGYLEQFGRVLIEAMACGLCVMGSNIGGIPNVIGDSGFLFEHSNAEEISKLITKLDQDRNELFAYKNRAYQRALSTYSYHSVANDVVSMISDVLNADS